MVKSTTPRDRRARRGPTKTSTLEVLVLCGGRRTEKGYLEALNQYFCSSSVRFRFDREKIGLAPSRLVTRGITQKANFAQVWCVFDVDNFDRTLTKGKQDDLTKAVVAARRAGINLAMSNPCFELWLLLHFAEHTAYLADARATARRLREHVPTYDKDRLDFQHFRDRVDDAVSRAKTLDPGDGHCPANPSTGMWELVELMRPLP